MTVALGTLVGISLVGQTDRGGAGSQAAGGLTARPGSAAMATASLTATPARASPRTASPGSQRGTPPPRAVVALGPVSACPPGSSPGRPGRATQTRPPLSSVTRTAFDRRAGRIVLLAAGPGGESPETWTFDVCTNTWTAMHPRQEPDASWALVYDADADVTISVGPGTWVYDLAANTWTQKAGAPIASGSGRVAYDPVAGRIVAFAPAGAIDPPEIWTYDVATDTWAPIAADGTSAVAPGDAGLLAYDASVDRIIAYNPGHNGGPVGTWLFDIRRGSWSKSGAPTPTANFGWFPSGGEIAYDEATAQTIVFTDGRMIGYDSTADRWELLDAGSSQGFATGPTARMQHSVVYDPVNERLVIYGGTYRTSDPGRMWVQADDVLAFDPVAREWTVLLEASTVQPVPS